MQWVDFEKQKPNRRSYFLCSIWGFSENVMGTYCYYKVCFFDGEEFLYYPEKEIRNTVTVFFEKVIWWSEIEKHPLNPQHSKC